MVVGASGAFGSALVAALVARGLTVLGVGRTSGPLQVLVDRHGSRVEPVLADVTDDRATDTVRNAIAGRTTLLAPEATAMTGSILMLDSGRRKGLP